jgi:hypothetical protein
VTYAGSAIGYVVRRASDVVTAAGIPDTDSMAGT